VTCTPSVYPCIQFNSTWPGPHSWAYRHPAGTCSAGGRYQGRYLLPPASCTTRPSICRPTTPCNLVPVLPVNQLELGVWNSSTPLRLGTLLAGRLPGSFLGLRLTKITDLPTSRPPILQSDPDDDISRPERKLKLSLHRLVSVPPRHTEPRRASPPPPSIASLSSPPSTLALRVWSQALALGCRPRPLSPAILHHVQLFRKVRQGRHQN
jgi:hypothetical protein